MTIVSEDDTNSVSLLAQQFAEFPHLASAAVSQKAGTSFVPAVEMTKTNPVRVAAVRADVENAFFWAVDVAAVVILHGFVIGAAWLAWSLLIYQLFTV
jgi:hypothetical protein